MTATPAERDLRVASTDRAGRERLASPGAAPSDDTTAPDGIWHGYPVTGSRTLCGRPLLELFLWPSVSWPAEAPTGSVCYACELVIENA